MTAYIYFKESKMIICKIDNIENIDINNREINGDSNIIFGESQDFIILQSDSINKNIGDTIDLTGLEDERDFFLKGKYIWLQEKLQKANEQISILTQNHEDLKQHVDMTDSTVNSIMTEVIPSIMS